MKQDLTKDVEFKFLTPSDKGFVVKTYIKGLHTIEPYNFIKNDYFKPIHSQLIEKFMAHSNILIAHIKNYPDELLGYVIFDITPRNLIFHYIHIKAILRGKTNLSNLLLKQIDFDNREIICTHFSKYFYHLQNQNPNISYNPYIL